MQLVRILLAGVLCACPTLSFGQQPAEPISFQQDIRAILSDKCFACHGPDAAARQADLRLDIRSEAEPLLSPGDVENSELIRRIQSDDPDEMMPPPKFKNRLTADEVARLGAWVAAGATYDEHWSFRPLHEVDPPAAPADGPWAQWPENTIDRFVLDQLLRKGRHPASPASKQRWLRRVSFDLIGLPPTPEELAAFLADDSPEAYESVVDALLERPEYGERMANAWLDIARYSDTYGYQVDRDRFVWPWRDWVIQAFNDNLPYNDFITWQLAGDLLPEPSREQILATTFCRLHPQKVEGGSVPEEFRVEYVADRTHTLATALLGLTMECARCHDHKYDPLTQRDYYRLFAYFNNIDEAGLYSYFTESVPTPTLPLTNDAQQQQLTDLAEQVRQAEQRLTQVSDAQAEAFAAWLENRPAILDLAGELKHLDFEQDAAGANRSIEGQIGQAIELTGDDGIDVGVGNFNRSQPFSVSLWMWCPDEKQRAVVFHRSRAWTDAGSRGYELLIDEGHLSWSLIHFWPGNAISIRSREPLPLGRWIQVTVASDGSSRAAGLRMYWDGQPIDTAVVRDHLEKNITGGGGDNITIGERFRDRGFTKGRVDEFRVFDRALSEIEVQQLFAPTSWSHWQAMPAAQLSTAERERLHDHYLATVDEAYRQARDELQKLRQQQAEILNGLTEIMVMQEMATRRPTYVLRRGAYDAPTEPVEPGTPAAILPLESQRPDRLGLAQWLTRPDHPLTGRVAVNRLWQMCFGHGLVRTPEDFGSQGAPPTHPKLLDWLAQDFVTHNWDQKRLLKQIVLSATYRQTSDVSREQYAADPENVELSRGPRNRLPAEMIRDNALYLSGLLVSKVGGPPVRPYEVSKSFKPVNPDSGDGLYRRSLYTYWKRTAPAPVMLALDATKRDVCTVKREQTSSPLQALVLLNDPQLVEASRVLAETLVENYGEDLNASLTELMLRAASREPTATEREKLARLFSDQLGYFAEHPDEATALRSIGQRPVREALEPHRVAAMTVVVSVVLNLDACVIKR